MVLERDIWLYRKKTNSQDYRDATFAKDFEGVIYIYRLWAKDSAKQLLVTVQSSPLIPDGELALYFRQLGMVNNVFA